MRLAEQIRMAFLSLFRRGQASTRLDDELRFHIDRQIEENISAGMSPEDARAAALRQFGNPALLRDQTRSTWTGAWLDSLVRDFRYVSRTLIHAPGFTLIAVFIIALGIGANVALFTLVHRVLLNPLPYPASDQLVSIYEHESGGSTHAYMPVAAGSFSEWQRASRGVADMAMVSPFQGYSVSAEGGKLPEKIEAAMCSWNFFSVLGVDPALGRSFGPADDSPNAEASVILSGPFWQRRYAGDPSVIGRKIWLDAKPYTVIGVLPESFVYSGAFGGNTVQVWTPIAHEFPPPVMTTFQDHEAIGIARLYPGTTLQALVSRLQGVQKQIKAGHPEPAVHDSVIGHSLLDDAVQDYKTPLYALLAATGCVLLIASMNVASLLVARIASRRKELAIRVALGGGWLRIMRERIFESLLLSIAGGATGLFLAYAALQWLVKTRHDMNRIEAIHIGGSELGFTILAVFVTALFAGLISAFSSKFKDVLGGLQDSSRGSSSRARAGLRRTLLVLEVSLTVVLLVGAGLLLKSYQRLRSTDVGVPVDNVLTLHVGLPGARYKTTVQRVAFFENVLSQVRALPGVQSAGLVSAAPGQGYGGDDLVTVVEHPPLPKGTGLDLQIRGADPGYFAAIHLPLIRGRVFTSDERLDRANVVVISQKAVEMCFPGEDPIGKHIKIGSDGRVGEVIGVVGDTRWNITEPPMPQMYWPVFGNDWANVAIIVRSPANVSAFAMPIQKIIGSLDPDLPVSGVGTLRESIAKSTIDSQFDSLLVLAFAVIALVLAAAGLYGVLTYLVTQRTSEIGIRIALGARREQLLRTILFDGIRPALLGLIVGLAGSAAAVRLIRSMLYQTEPLDPAVFASVAVLLLAVATLACILPAWRASRLDPIQALRTE